MVDTFEHTIPRLEIVHGQLEDLLLLERECNFLLLHRYPKVKAAFG